MDKVNSLVIDGYEFAKIDVPGDGSCLIHSILSCISRQYNLKNASDKYAHSRKVRDMLAEKLTESEYEKLSKGNIKYISESMPEFTLDSMKKLLLSNRCIDSIYMEHIMNCFKINIIIFEKNLELYKGLEGFYKNDVNIFIYYEEEASHFTPLYLVEDNHYRGSFHNDTDVVKHFTKK